MWDEWDFLTPFFRGNATILELFTWQHGPHREGIGLIPDKFLYPITAWNVRGDAFIIGGCIFAAMLLALLLKRRLFGSLSYFDIAIPLLFLTLNQFETLIGVPNPAYAGFPLLLIVIYCHILVLQRHLVFKYAALLLTNFLLIFTGFGIFMGAVTLVILALECYRSARGFSSVPLRAPLAALILGMLSLASFFVDYKFSPAIDCFQFPYHPVANYGWFVVILFSRFLIGARGLVFATCVGTVVTLLTIGLTVLDFKKLVGRENPAIRRWVTLALTMYSLLFAVDCAVGRVCSGLPAAAQASRYVSLLIPAFLGLYFWLLSLPGGAVQNAALAVFLIAIAPGSLRAPVKGMERSAKIKRIWSECYRRTENVGYCNEAAGYPVYLDNSPGRPALQQKLDYLKTHHLNFFSDGNNN